GDYANVADTTAVDPTYVDGYMPSVSVGSSVSAYLQHTGDYDVFSFTAGVSQTVRVNVNQSAGSSVETVLQGYDSTGTNRLYFNDDSGGTLNSQVVFYATAGTNYKLVVGAYGNNTSGGYQLTVNPYYVIAYPVLSTAILVETGGVSGGLYTGAFSSS